MLVLCELVLGWGSAICRKNPPTEKVTCRKTPPKCRKNPPHRKGDLSQKPPCSVAKTPPGSGGGLRHFGGGFATGHRFCGGVFATFGGVFATGWGGFCDLPEKKQHRSREFSPGPNALRAHRARQRHRKASCQRICLWARLRRLPLATGRRCAKFPYF